MDIFARYSSAVCALLVLPGVGSSVANASGAPHLALPARCRSLRRLKPLAASRGASIRVVALASGFRAVVSRGELQRRIVSELADCAVLERPLRLVLSLLDTPAHARLAPVTAVTESRSPHAVTATRSVTVAATLGLLAAEHAGVMGTAGIAWRMGRARRFGWTLGLLVASTPEFWAHVDNIALNQIGFGPTASAGYDYSIGPLRMTPRLGLATQFIHGWGLATAEAGQFGVGEWRFAAGPSAELAFALPISRHLSAIASLGFTWLLARTRLGRAAEVEITEWSHPAQGWASFGLSWH